MSQYPVPKSGLDALAAKIQGIERSIAAMRSAAGTSSQVISNPETGARIMLVDGEIRVWDNYDANPDGYGLIYTDSDAAANLVRLFPPHDAGNGLQNSFTMRGTSPGTPGAGWWFTDGVATIVAEDSVYLKGATGIDVITGGALNIFELPTTGSAANLRLDPSTAAVQVVVSSRRYKQAIEDAPIDVDAFLRLRPRSWLDKGEYAKDPETASRNYGFIAEEVAELGLPFVDFNADGEPDALQYDRFMVGAVQVMQAQAAVIADLTARLGALEARGA